MAGEALNMNQLAINNFHCKLKDLCFKTATKQYTNRYAQYLKQKRRIKIDFEQTYWEINYANTKIN